MILKFQLDSIKWYKDGREFYRLHPHDGQRREFHTPGVNIDANLTLVSHSHKNTQLHKHTNTPGVNIDANLTLVSH